MSGSTISNPLSQGGDTSSWSSDPLSTWLMQQRQAQLRAQPFDMTSFSQAPTLSWQTAPNALTAPWSGQQAPPTATGGAQQPQPSPQDAQAQQQWQQQQAAQQQWMQQQMQAQQQAMQPWQQQYANVAAAYGQPVNQQWLQGAGAAPGYPRDGTG